MDGNAIQKWILTAQEMLARLTLLRQNPPAWKKEMQPDAGCRDQYGSEAFELAQEFFVGRS